MPKREFDREYEQLTLQGNPLLSDHTVADIEQDKKTVRRERPRLSSNAKAIRKEKAADLVQSFDTGDDIYILTRGHCSMIELIETVLERTGPADIHLSTWTAGLPEIDEFEQLLKSGKIKSCHWLFDLSFKSRRPACFAKTAQLFGADRIRQCWNHTKMTLIGNGEHKVTILSTANLNINLRLEYYIIRQSPEFYDFNRQWFMELFE